MLEFRTTFHANGVKKFSDNAVARSDVTRRFLLTLPQLNGPIVSNSPFLYIFSLSQKRDCIKNFLLHFCYLPLYIYAFASIHYITIYLINLINKIPAQSLWAISIQFVDKYFFKCTGYKTITFHHQFCNQSGDNFMETYSFDVYHYIYKLCI